MDLEVLDPEPDGDTAAPRARGVLLWIGLGVAALVAGLLVVGQAKEPAAAGLSGQNGPKPTRTLPPGPGQRQYVAVSQVCPPVTDGRTRLAISFRVTNVSPETLVAVDSVRGILPIGGLTPVGPATAGGTCRRPGTTPVAKLERENQGSDLFGWYPVDSELAAGDSRLYTLNFRLPKRCPAPYPIKVRVGFVADGFADSNVNALVPDLSVVDFGTCPSSTPVASSARERAPSARTR